MKAFRLAVACGALILGLGAPAAAVTAVQPATTAVLDAGFQQQYRAGSFDIGRLDLSISGEGIVSGYFRPEYGTFQVVTGGLEGNRIWLDLGASPRRRITGTFEDGRITGSVLGSTPPDLILFSATPASSP